MCLVSDMADFCFGRVEVKRRKVDGMIFQIGVAQCRVDIISKISGVSGICRRGFNCPVL